MNAIIQKIQAMPVKQIQEMVAKLANDIRDEAGVVLSAALDVLESKMEESETYRKNKRLCCKESGHGRKSAGDFRRDF